MSIKEMIKARKHLEKTIAEGRKPHYGDLLTVIRALAYMVVESNKKLLTAAGDDEDRAILQDRVDIGNSMIQFSGKWAR